MIKIPTTHILAIILTTSTFFSIHQLRAEEILRVSPNLENSPIWKTLLKTSPPPPKILIKYTKRDPKTSQNVISIENKNWYEQTKSKGTLSLAKEIKHTILLPIVPLLDSRNTVSIKTLQRLHKKKSLKAHGISILPISHIVTSALLSNSKAILVDNKAAFERGYKLVNREILKLENPTSLVANWFKKIPTDTVQKNNEKIIWIVAVGDVMLARRVDQLLLQRDGTKKVFGNTLPYLQAGDILLGNLECVASLIGHRLKKSYTFHFNPKALGPLRKVGFSYFSITNNHSLDYGISAFLDALKNLERYHLGFSGGGRNLEEASQPWTTNIDTTTVKILSVGAYPNERTGFSGLHYIAKVKKPGILWLNNYFFTLSRKIFKKNSLNIVMVHGGVEWTSVPTPKQVTLYREMIENGADIVIGSHPHFVQGFEKYRGKFIAYSLGNFLFPGMEDTGYGNVSIILKLGVYKKNVLYIIPTPVRLNRREVRITKNLNIVGRFYRLSKIIMDRYH